MSKSGSWINNHLFTYTPYWTFFYGVHSGNDVMRQKPNMPALAKDNFIEPLFAEGSIKRLYLENFMYVIFFDVD